MVILQQFEAVVHTAKVTAGSDESMQFYSIPTLQKAELLSRVFFFFFLPTLPVKFGHTLKKASDILLGNGLINGDQTQVEKARGFAQLYDMR